MKRMQSEENEVESKKKKKQGVKMGEKKDVITHCVLVLLDGNMERDYVEVPFFYPCTINLLRFYVISFIEKLIYNLCLDFNSHILLGFEVKVAQFLFHSKDKQHLQYLPIRFLYIFCFEIKFQAFGIKKQDVAFLLKSSEVGEIMTYILLLFHQLVGLKSTKLKKKAKKNYGH